MKNTIKTIGIVCCTFGLFSLSSCDNEDNLGPTANGMNQTSNDVTSVNSFLTSSNGLIISLLTDDNENETYYFDSFTFSFNSNGAVSATNGNTTVDGTYNVFLDDGRVELAMSFPNTLNFLELNDDWYFISIDQNTIRFNDDGDQLHFQQL